MATAEDWQEELRRWLGPFLSHLGHKARRRMCPLYVAGLIGPGERKSVQPMASRTPAADYDQLHHFVGAGIWDEAPLERELIVQADRLVGGADAVLVIDDTALPKKGKHSVGVAPQYATVLGKQANCQTLVSRSLVGRCRCRSRCGSIYRRSGPRIPPAWSRQVCLSRRSGTGPSPRLLSPSSIVCWVLRSALASCSPMPHTAAAAASGTRSQSAA
jgi:hypothetical protein